MLRYIFVLSMCLFITNGFSATDCDAQELLDDFGFNGKKNTAKEWLSDEKNSIKAKAIEGMDSETLSKIIFQVKDFVLPTSNYKVMQFNE